MVVSDAHLALKATIANEFTTTLQRCWVYFTARPADACRISIVPGDMVVAMNDLGRPGFRFSYA